MNPTRETPDRSWYSQVGVWFWRNLAELLLLFSISGSSAAVHDRCTFFISGASERGNGFRHLAVGLPSLVLKSYFTLVLPMRSEWNSWRNARKVWEGKSR